MKKAAALAVALLVAQAACDSLAPQLVDNVDLHDTEELGPTPTKTMPSTMASVGMTAEAVRYDLLWLLNLI